MSHKMPFFQLFPLDWLRDTAKLSPAAQGHWMRILCYAWNEPKRGIYKREIAAMGYELGVSQADLQVLLKELEQVAEVRKDEGVTVYVTVMSRRMIREERERSIVRKRVARFRGNAECNADVTHEKRISNGDVTPKKLEVRSQKLDKDIKDICPFDFESLWANYPSKTGHKAAERAFKASVKTPKDYADIQMALGHYVASKRVKAGYIQNGSTWFNDWQGWIEPEGGVNGTNGSAGPISYRDKLRKQKEAEKLREDLTPREVSAGVGDLPHV